MSNNGYYKTIIEYGGAGLLLLLLIALLWNIENAMKIETGFSFFDSLSKVSYVIAIFAIIFIVAVMAMKFQRKEYRKGFKLGEPEN